MLPVPQCVQVLSRVLTLAMMLALGCQASPNASHSAAVQRSGPAGGIPAVTGYGAVAMIPPGPRGATGSIAADLGGGWVATVVVPSAPSRALAVRIQALPNVPAAEGLPVSLGIPVIGVRAELYEADTARVLADADYRVELSIRPPPGIDPSSYRLLLQDPSTGRYRLLDGEPEVPGGRVPGSATVALVRVPWTGSTARSEAHALPAPHVRAPLPARVRIPTLAIDAPIEPVGLDEEGFMASPGEPHVVGWYELGPRPGEPSNAVLAGHLDLLQQPGVFRQLGQLREGESIEVVAAGNARFHYRVKSVQSYPADGAVVREIFGRATAPTLTLVTCGGSFDSAARQYSERVVVKARAEVSPRPPGYQSQLSLPVPVLHPLLAASYVAQARSRTRV